MGIIDTYQGEGSPINKRMVDVMKSKVFEHLVHRNYTNSSSNIYYNQGPKNACFIQFHSLEIKSLT